MVFAKMDAGAAITGVVLLVLLITVLSVALPEINTAGQTLNATGLPFSTFFQTNGIIMLAIMGAVIVAVVGFVAAKAKR